MSTSLSTSPAFDALYATHARYVACIARRLSDDNPDDAADLAQEGWLAVLQVPEARWTEARYIRTVLFRAMLRWRATEAGLRCITPRETSRPMRPTQRQTTVDPLRFRAGVPQPQLGAPHIVREHVA